MLKVVPTAAMSILNSSELLKKSFKSMLMIAASLLDFPEKGKGGGGGMIKSFMIPATRISILV